MIETSLVEAVGSYGFPIVATIYLLWERTHILKDLSDKQAATAEALTLAVNELTVVIRERIP